jgi:hypothetical protein
VLLVGLAVGLLLLARMPVPLPVASGVAVIESAGAPVGVSVEDVVGRELPRAGFMIVRVESDRPVTIIAPPAPARLVEPGSEVSLGVTDTIYVGCEGGCRALLNLTVYAYTTPYSWLALVAIPLGLLGAVLGFVGTVLVWLEAPWLRRRRARRG